VELDADAYAANTATAGMAKRAIDIPTLFYSGKHAEVIARVIDGPGQRGDSASAGPVRSPAPKDAAYGVASLACIGRLDDAMGVLGANHDAPPKAVATARFFLAVAYLRAGNLSQAKSLAMDIITASRRNKDPENRFYAWQVLACLRFFSGSLARAAELARRALDAAFRAGSSYARVLATDLRGHAFVHLGRVHAGIELLRRARALAASGDFAGHCAAIDHALVIYEVRFGFLSVEEAVARVTSLGALDCQDSYSARSASIELSTVLAFAGRGTEAQALLRQVSTTFVPEGDRRLRIRFLAAAAFVASLREGRRAALRYVAEAEQELAQIQDRALAIEVLCARAWVADDSERPAIVAALLKGYRDSGGIARALVHARALSADAPIPDSTRLVGFEEDRTGALIASLREKEGPLKLLAERYFGLYPRSQGLEPGLRIYLLAGGMTLVEEMGDVRLVQLSARLDALLVALSRGERKKEELLSEVWGIHKYDSERHDPVIHTALSRLRALLVRNEPRAHAINIESGAMGYRLSAGVEVRGTAKSLRDEAMLEDATEAVEFTSGQRERPPPEPPRMDRLLGLLHSVARSSRELATELELSEMTVLRELRKLVTSGLVHRTGHGRATRYQASDTPQSDSGVT
jgi:tetratricopeptide (TPR) repeat protein